MATLQAAWLLVLIMRPTLSTVFFVKPEALSSSKSTLSAGPRMAAALLAQSIVLSDDKSCSVALVHAGAAAHEQGLLQGAHQGGTPVGARG